MTYNDFTNKLAALLLYDSIEDDDQHAAFIDQHVRSWMSTMQYLVNNFKVRNENTYREADVNVSCDGATVDLPSDLNSLIRVEFVKPDDYPRTIVVAGAGTAAANLTYTKDESLYNAKPSYTNGDYTIRWNGVEWELVGVASALLYSSADDVVSPDLVTTWTQETGDLAVPTVTKGNSCDDVISMYPVNYDDRNELLNKECKYSGCYKYAIDKRATRLTIYPYPREDYEFGPQYLQVTWEGVKSDYEGSDVIPFGDDTIDNCAHYVNAQLARKKEDKLVNYRSYYESYLEGRKEIALIQREKAKQRP